MDFMVGLLRIKNNQANIWVIIDKLTKSTNFLPINKMHMIDKLVEIYLREIVINIEFQ